MASTYSALKIQLMATGENSGTWGNVTNDNLGIAIEEAIAESADVAFTGSNVSITLSDTNASQVARNLRLNLTGTSVASTQALTVPDIEKPYIVNNGLTDDVEVKNSTGANVTVPAGKTMWVYSTGAGVVNAMNAGENLTGLNASNVSSGTLSNARTNASSSNSASTIVARDASGNFAANIVTAVNVNSATLASCTVDGTNSVGFRNIPQSGSAKTTSYTLTTGDIGKLIEVGSGGSITVPNATFAAGDAVVIFNNTSGSITLTMSITTSFIGGTDADDNSISLATRGVCNILFISGTVCVVTGNVT
jgi:trimeric autotransporter adhesin